MVHKKLKYLFLVQGEGRGHMTQAISLFELLESSGHEVCAVLTGSSGRRQLPEFFSRRISAPIIPLPSPNFVTDKNNRSLRLGATILQNLQRLPVYFKSLRTIHRAVKQYNPDVIINFYDFLGGLYNGLYKPYAHYVCIGHQYLSHHPDFPFAPGKTSDRRLLLLNNKITAWGAEKLLALSFRPYPTHQVPKLTVTPPLLRKELATILPEKQSFFLAYVVNDGYAEDIIQWHQQHPEVQLQCFWDRKDMPEVHQPHPNLTFHRIDDKKFIRKMSQCAGYISTAGFESICEAMFMDKAVMMVPVEGHYEQACNAVDGERAGAGIASKKFDLDRFFEYLPNHKPAGVDFRRWATETEHIYLRELTCFERSASLPLTRRLLRWLPGKAAF